VRDEFPVIVQQVVPLAMHLVAMIVSMVFRTVTPKFAERSKVSRRLKDFGQYQVAGGQRVVAK
jgi:hypothetical protein